MPETQRPLFDFETEAQNYEQVRELIRDFAGHDAFRSAMVEELVLDEDFYRRPVRPEDLSFINFSKPVERDTITRLPFLAAQRILLAINELKVARLPREGSKFPEYARFYETTNQVIGARIRPLLEAFSFSFLGGDHSADASADGIGRKIAEIVEIDAERWSRMLANLAKADYLEEGLRYILIQNRSLAPSKRYALGGAAAFGFFDLLPTDARPTLVIDPAGDGLSNELAAACGVTKREHSYWQFYLSTSMAGCNLLHALGSRPDRALQFVGAAFAAEAQWLAFGCLVGQGARRLGLQAAETASLDIASCLTDLNGRVARAVAAVANQYGEFGLRQVSQGLEASESLSTVVWSNLSEQLRWLSSVERYQAIAHAIDARIQAECPDIDRETFVEPREMCSTTHVHDDHRLVVVESGDMVFWGNLGMTLRLKPGEMVLVPQGRLHGSSIESEECTYHQPIIPEEWIQPLVNDAHRDFAAL